MKQTYDRPIHVLTGFILVLTVIITAIGIFSQGGTAPYEFLNQYGDKIKINGSGIYAHDSFFAAPIFRGTDLTMLLIAVPLLGYALTRDLKKHTMQARMFLLSVLGLFTYYATSIAMGVTYNQLHLAYIALFSASLFALILSFMSIDYQKVPQLVKGKLPYRGFSIFLGLTGVALFLAWLPDILTSLASGRSLELIEVYTTAITYVIDMGIISPVAFVALYLLKKKSGLGFVLLELLLTVCIVVGIMFPMQTVFQTLAGIELTPAVLVTKVGTFCALSLFSLYLQYKLTRAMN
jgi:hypothetical protein